MGLLIIIITMLACIFVLCVEIHRHVRRYAQDAAEIRRAADMLSRLWPLLRLDQAPPSINGAPMQSQVVSPTRRRQMEEEADEA